MWETPAHKRIEVSVSVLDTEGEAAGVVTRPTDRRDNLIDSY